MMNTPNLQNSNYSSWNLNINFKKNDLDSAIQSSIHAAILAPSIHNTQPWIIERQGNAVILKPDLAKHLKYADPLQRGLYISLGCFVTNFELTANAFGKEVLVEIKIDKNTNEIKLTVLNEQPKKSEINLVKTIPNRFSDKGYFLESKLQSQHIKLLQQVIPQDFKLSIVENDEIINEVSKQYYQSAYRMAKSKEFREELSNWLKPNDTDDFFGMPGFVSGLPLGPSKLGWMIRYLPVLAKMQVTKDTKKLADSPTIAIITHPENSILTYVHVGRVFEKVYLTAASAGIHLTPMFGLVEDKQGSKFLSSLIKQKHVHAFFRMGYSSNPILHTPRKPL